MTNRYEVKVRGRLGPGSKDAKSIRILNRVLEWTSEGLVYEADQRHGEIIVQQLCLNNGSATLSTPGVKVKVSEDDNPELSSSQASMYRALVARANFCVCR